MDRATICYVPSAIAAASLTGLDSTSQFLPPARFNKNKLPPLVKNPLHVCWNVHNLTRRYHLVITVNVAIIELFIPKTVLSSFIFFHIVHLRLMPDLT